MRRTAWLVLCLVAAWPWNAAPGEPLPLAQPPNETRPEHPSAPPARLDGRTDERDGGPWLSQPPSTASPPPAEAPAPGGVLPPGLPDGGFLGGALPEPPEAPPVAGDGEQAMEAEPGEVLIASAGLDEARALAKRLAQAGYRLRRRHVLHTLGLVLDTYRVPAGARVAAVLGPLRERLPDRWLDANHRYRVQGDARTPRRYARALIGWRGGPRCGAGLTLGLIDTGVDAAHPALAGRALEQFSLLRGGERAAAPDHGTAIAALLLGAPGTDFEGLLPAARLKVAAVMRAGAGRHPETTAERLVRALDRLATGAANPVLFSLGGPPNRLLELALRRARQRGLMLVAAAGNDDRGPVYPAAYPGVVGVAAVDAALRRPPRAGRGAQVDFAAPGVDVWSAAPGGGGRYFTGSSFAVPFVAAALAVELGGGRGAAAAVDALARGARDLGAPGRDPEYGHGLLRHSGCGAQPR